MASRKVKKGDRVKYVGSSPSIPYGKRGTAKRDESAAGYVLVKFDRIARERNVKASNLELL